MCPLNVDLLSVTFDPETADIRLLIVTHPVKIQPFFHHCRASHTKNTELRPTKFCQMLEDLRALIYTIKFV